MPFKFTFLFTASSTFGAKLGAYTQSVLRRVGIAMELKKLDWSIYSQALREGRFDACTLIWGNTDVVSSVPDLAFFSGKGRLELHRLQQPEGGPAHRDRPRRAERRQTQRDVPRIGPPAVRRKPVHVALQQAPARCCSEDSPRSPPRRALVRSRRRVDWGADAMSRFLIRRLLWMIPSFLGITFVVFAIIKLIAWRSAVASR